MQEKVFASEDWTRTLDKERRGIYQLRLDATVNRRGNLS